MPGMGQPDREQYENAMRDLERIVSKIDSIEKRARRGEDVWRPVHFLRVNLRELQSAMQAWQPPGEEDSPDTSARSDLPEG